MRTIVYLLFFLYFIFVGFVFGVVASFYWPEQMFETFITLEAREGMYKEAEQ